MMEKPPSVPDEVTPDIGAVRAVIDRALAKGRSWLGEAEAKSVFAAYGIPIATTRVVAAWTRRSPPLRKSASPSC